MTIRFLLDGETIELADIDPTATVLDYLRYRMRRTGTKEGCAEGDCGACTVLVGSPDGDAVKWRAVNSCIQFLPMLHGKALLTVESLKEQGAPNPLQSCMAANGSSQCGFCTPGFVMSLYGRAIGASGSDLPVADVIAGNLCRCTGYGPILEAGETVDTLGRDDVALAAQLRAIGADGASGEWQGRKWFAPASSDELAELLVEFPQARLVAGATDVGLWVTKGLKSLDTVIFLGDVADLAAIEESDDALIVGAGVRYADAHAPFAQLHPDFGELVRRIGGLQVRNAGTVGGNIANGSPIGDGPPALIALGAELTLRSATGRRTMPLEAYFLDYGKQDRQPGEFVESIRIPRPGPDAVIHIAKLSRRFDSDISAVCGAFALTVEDGTITGARVAFGGMAATPKRATACEAALIGKPFIQTTIETAAEALRQDFAPLTDVRGSSAYRLEAAANLLRRLWLREQGTPISVLEMEAGL
ncbi:xanthine dehydrogenase small subunit [Novosphingobium mangrovi (ex Huang et al. 2023)]|uniref:Xanthine dehydrogenase small subunit n=1 Tax=Novosphingobium mangrovi (ex Huang et al. 2023) TaxID=2976432 RepID=A0ABT2I2E5_9SPHN|nr:xanthine dehydrogenase small subunit [Novosphingobium mangrovi (ex Huang et al. 2023)]MCT2398975.1 xanthine dehydrogenase small subunit [Novosphingobium mangrovi (ex Huang et al. 2023)]